LTLDCTGIGYLLALAFGTEVSLSLKPIKNMMLLHLWLDINFSKSALPTAMILRYPVLVLVRGALMRFH